MKIKGYYFLLIPIILLTACVHSGRNLGYPIRKLKFSEPVPKYPNVVGRIRLSSNLIWNPEDVDSFLSPYYFSLIILTWVRHIDLRLQKFGYNEIYYKCLKSIDGWFYLNLEPGDYHLHDFQLVDGVITGSIAKEQHFELTIPINCDIHVGTDSITYLGTIEIRKDTHWKEKSLFARIYEMHNTFKSDIRIVDESGLIYSRYPEKFRNLNIPTIFKQFKCPRGLKFEEH